MVVLKTAEEIKIMAEGGRIAGQILGELARRVRPGLSTLELDREAERMIKEAGGEPGFKRVPHYYHSICTAVNEEVVHGIPKDRKLRPGDIVSIDLGVFYRGFHSDTAVTVGVGEIGEATKKFLEVGRRALSQGIAQVRVGNRIGDISAAVEKILRGAGYGIVESLAGHGVGRELHEEPLVPNLGRAGSGLELSEGMVIAIEPIYTDGSPDVHLEKDGWTITSEKGSLAGHFEHTVAVTEKGPLVLTQWLDRTGVIW